MNSVFNGLSKCISMLTFTRSLSLALVFGLGMTSGSSFAADGTTAEGTSAASKSELTGDWPQWAGDSARNNVAVGKGVPTEWDTGKIDRKTGVWDRSSASKNVLWVARVGSQTYGNPVVAEGRLFVGTNNGAGYLSRYPATDDLGVMLAFDTKDGSFLWQHSSEKLPTGRVHDWPLQGICCAPLVEGDKMWFVTSRGEVICADPAGYRDGEDDGPAKAGFARLFKESPTAVSGLSDGQFPVAIAGVLSNKGFKLDQRVRVDVIDETSWKLTLRGEKISYILVTQKGDKVELAVLKDREDAGPGEALATVSNNLIASLAQGELSDTLVDLLKFRGFPIENVAKVTPGSAKNEWLVDVTSKGKPRQLKIRQEGPAVIAFKQVTTDDVDEADEIWKLDMMGQLGVSQHNMCSCSVTALGDLLFVHTSNGVDESHINVPNINAPSFITLDKNTGKVLWTDKSPGENILHGQWSSPTIAVIGGEPQVLFAGGDGWLYSFKANAGKNGQPEFLWKFDANPKTSEYILQGRSTRNHLIATPVVYKEKVFVAVGEDPEHGVGNGHLWCIDPTKRGDISAELAVSVSDRTKVLPHRRLIAVIEKEGEIAIDNPNSGAVWHYEAYDLNGDGKIAYEEAMHRTMGSVAIKDDLLFIVDLSGIVHCLDANTGLPYWTYDMKSQAWSTPLITENKVYIGDEDGNLYVFNFSKEAHDPIAKIDMKNSVYSTAILSHNVLYIANKTHVYAIQGGGE
jgi:outer membrane protein assembly factor BamB